MMMLNDRSSPAALIATRRSGKPRDMVAPGPDADQLKRILTSAMRVPDHGKLAPWRFIIIEEEQRSAFCELLQRAYLIDKPDARRIEMEGIEQFAYQAPTLVIVISKPDYDSHILRWEQELSAGAACMALLLAAHSEGFVGSWLTTWAANAPMVLSALGHSEGRISGFMFIGSQGRRLEDRPRPNYETVVSNWKV